MPAPVGFAEHAARIAYGEQPQVRRLQEAPRADSVEGVAKAAPAGEFAERLQELVQRTDGMQKSAESKIEAVASGQSNDLHGTMIAVQQADIQLKLMTTVRNKVIEAYREVMRMGA